MSWTSDRQIEIKQKIRQLESKLSQGSDIYELYRTKLELDRLTFDLKLCRLTSMRIARQT